MLIGKTRTNQPVEGYQDAPVFEGEFEQKEDKVILNMEDKDLEYIYVHKPMVIGVRVADEDEEGKFQIIYFTLAVDRKETDDAIMYQLVMTDDKTQDITKLSLSFLDDGDGYKVVYGEEEQKTLPPVELEDEHKLLGVVVDDDNNPSIGLVNPPASGTKLYQHQMVFPTGNFSLYIVSKTATSYSQNPQMFGFFINAIQSDSPNIVSMRVKTLTQGLNCEGCPVILGTGSGYYYGPDKTSIDYAESVMDTVSDL